MGKTLYGGGELGLTVGDVPGARKSRFWNVFGVFWALPGNALNGTIYPLSALFLNLGAWNSNVLKL